MASKHPVGVVIGAYNDSGVMCVNITLGPKDARKQRGDDPDLASYAGVFGFSPSKLPDAPHY